MFGSIGMTEILVVVFIAMLIFGPSMLRHVGKKTGENIRESKKVIAELKDAIKGD